MALYRGRYTADVVQRKYDATRGVNELCTDAVNEELFVRGGRSLLTINHIHLIFKLHSPEVDPDLFALQVGLQACLLVTSEVGDIQTLDGNAKLLSQQLQGHLTGQLLQRGVARRRMSRGENETSVTQHMDNNALCKSHWLLLISLDTQTQLVSSK